MKCKGDVITDILFIKAGDAIWDRSGLVRMKRKYGKFKRQITRQVINKDRSPFNNLNKK